VSGFWSGWVIALVVFNIGVTLFLFVWALRVAIPTQPDGTSGHVWAHGVLREAVRRLPTWWVVASTVALAAGIGYLVFYPGFGAFPGRLGWTSGDELSRAQEANRKLEAPLRERIRGKPVEAIAAEPQALRAGRVLYVENCAACHGRDARGNRALGAPDLTDRDSLYGNDGKAILASVLDGRKGEMPPQGAGKSEQELRDIAHYVLSLSGRTHDGLRALFGKPNYAPCAACHGAEGKGNPALGAPNLADDVWLHGETLEDIVAAIRHGRSGVMPAWRGRLGEDDAALVAAWVYAQSQR
jgi:cytochrome c oxidase cbb3-type subunit 3